MATNLYEILEINANATDEEVRRAYRRKALQTHPDRLPPSATPEQKAASEDLFRKVNNAYEVLNNAQTRQQYDLHGVWPPPQGGSSQMPGGSGSFGPFSNPPFGGNSFPFSDSFFNRGTPGFTNPFSLFDSIFGYDSQRHTFRGSHASGGDPFARMEAEMNNLFNTMPGSRTGFNTTPGPQATPMSGPFGGFASFNGFGGFGSFGPFQNSTMIRAGPGSSGSSSSMSWSFGGGMGGNGGSWSTSESYSTSSVNGVTQSIHKRRDANGNEHITRKYPDGREVYTINGVEQTSVAGEQAPAGLITEGPGYTQPQVTHSSSSHHYHQHRSSHRSSTLPTTHEVPSGYSASDGQHHHHSSRRSTADYTQHGAHHPYQYPEPAKEPARENQPRNQNEHKRNSWYKKWLPFGHHHTDDNDKGRS